MKCPNRDVLSCGWRWIIGFVMAATLGFSHGQVPGLKAVLGGQAPAKPESVEKPDEIRARLDRWLQEARETVTRLESATPPGDVNASEVEARRRDLEQMVLMLNRSIKSLNAFTDAEKEIEAKRAEDASWTGFKEKPPFSLLMIDELLNERDAIKAKLTSQEASLVNFENLLTGIISEAKSAEGTVSSGMLSVKGSDEKSAGAAKWRLDAAREKSRLLAVRANLMQSSCDALKLRVAATRIDLALVDRKVATASSSSRFNDEDLAKINKISEERRASLHKEIENISKRLKTAVNARNQAQSALESLEAPTAESGKNPEGLELAKFRLEVAEGRVETLQSNIEGLESLVQLENVTCQIYQIRRGIIESRSLQERENNMKQLSQSYDRLKALENVIANDLSATGADLSKLESRAASISADDARFSLLNEQRTARSEKLTMLQRISQAVILQRKLARRWILEYAPGEEPKGWLQNFSDFAATAGQAVGKLWSFELMNFEDKVVVDGQTITGKIPVTLGTLLRALLFLVIGYWILSRIANRIQAGMVRHGHIAEAQARTLRNWAMIVVGFFLVIGTFSFLKIPLTVFAFFGGALAIGIGFGTQTLIKNFISGIILLVERKVRVGDMLEVDGFLGRVTEINTRSSVIRNAEDMETMVPNSLFLENRVTNWTLTSSKVRRTLQVGVAYGSPVQKVMSVLTESAGRHGLICNEPAPFAIFQDFGESALVFHLYYWLEMGGNANPLIVASDLRLMIEKRFIEHGIGVPFPQRDLHINSDQPLKVRWSKDPDQSDEHDEPRG